MGRWDLKVRSERAEPDVLVTLKMAPGWQTWPFTEKVKAWSGSESLGASDRNSWAKKKSTGRPLGSSQNWQEIWRNWAWKIDRNQER